MRYKSLKHGSILTERIIENCGVIGSEYVVVFLDAEMWESPDILRWSSGKGDGGGSITLGVDVHTGLLRGVISTINDARISEPVLEFGPDSLTGVPIFDINQWPVGKSQIISDYRPTCCWTEDGRFAVEINHGIEGAATECIISPQLSIVFGPDKSVLGLIFGALSLTDKVVLEQAEFGYIKGRLID